MKANIFNIIDNYQEYSIYGISAIELADYSLCFYLNKYLDINLSKEIDFEFNSEIKNEFLHEFTFFNYHSQVNKLNTFLLANTNLNTSIFPNYSFYNFLLVFDRTLRESEKSFLFDKVSLIDNVFEINYIDFKNKTIYQNFCYEFELFITNIAYEKENMKLEVLKNINEKYRL